MMNRGFSRSHTNGPWLQLRVWPRQTRLQPGSVGTERVARLYHSGNPVYRHRILSNCCYMLAMDIFDPTVQAELAANGIVQCAPGRAR